MPCRSNGVFLRSNQNPPIRCPSPIEVDCASMIFKHPSELSLANGSLRCPSAPIFLASSWCSSRAAVQSSPRPHRAAPPSGFCPQRRIYAYWLMVVAPSFLRCAGCHRTTGEPGALRGHPGALESAKLTHFQSQRAPRLPFGSASGKFATKPSLALCFAHLKIRFRKPREFLLCKHPPPILPRNDAPAIMHPQLTRETQRKSVVGRVCALITMHPPPPPASFTMHPPPHPAAFQFCTCTFASFGE